MLNEQLTYIKDTAGFTPDIAVILGSGLGGFAEGVEEIARIPYSALDGFPVSTAPGHRGELILGTLGEKKVAVFSGRIHLYEGYTPEEVVMPVRLAKAMGAGGVILTNASGGISKELNTGDIMLIKDHISLFVPSPLIGKNDDGLGVRFPDMSNAYDKDVRHAVKLVAAKCKIDVKEGVYAQLTGPQFESPAEIKLLSAVGADAVGMSTVIEAIAANHCGLKVCALSLIANLACGILDKPLSGDDVTEAANEAAPKFNRLLTEIIKIL